MKSLCLLIAIWSLIVLPGLSIANPEASKQQRAALALSGGISLGSYEAGLNWAIVKHYRNRSLDRAGPYQPMLGTFSGASAGNINALLSAISMCVASGNEETFSFSSKKNLFRDVWLEIGFENLLPDPNIVKSYEDDDALMSRTVFNSVIVDIRKHLEKEIYQPGCTVPFAITVTRKNAAEINPAGTSITVKNSRFVIPMQLVVEKADMAGKTKRATIYSLGVDEDHRYLGNVIYLAGGELVNSKEYPLTFDTPKQRSVAQAILASSAFPGAFGKKKLDYCIKDIATDRKDTGCATGYRRESADFVDGGIFDNVPLGALRAISTQDSDLPEPDHYLFLDPDIRRSQSAVESSGELCEGEEKNQPLGELFSQLDFFPDAVATARQYELYNLVRHNEAWLKKIRTPSRYFGLTASFMGNFGAFWDKGFRHFDYAVGIYDAAYYLAGSSTDSKPAAKDVIHVFKTLDIDSSSEVGTVFGLLLKEEFGNISLITESSNQHANMKKIFHAMKTLAHKKEPSGARCFEQFIENLFAEGSDSYQPNQNSFLNHLAHPRNRNRGIEAWMYPLTSRLSERVIALNDNDGDPTQNLATKFTALGINSVYRDETRLFTASSAPTDSFWFRLLPYEIAVDSANGGTFVAYEWQLLPLPHQFSLRLKASPFIWYRSSGIISRSSQLDPAIQYRFNNGLNVGLAPTVNFSWSKPGEDVPINYGVAGYIGYVDKFRITSGVRSLHGDFGGKNFYVLIGITDLPGIAYWLTR
ncbi:MAG: patatin-like phospholipase family protein [Mariprofundaceae bacterium]